MILDGKTLKDRVEDGSLIATRTLLDGSEMRLISSDLHIGPNSIDVTLGGKMLVATPKRAIDPYDPDSITHEEYTPREHIRDAEPNFLLYPGTVYLGFAAERFSMEPSFWPCPTVQMLDGRSTIGRIGITVHVTAGFGDIGFAGNFTLELVNLNTVPVILHPGMRIGQISWHTVSRHEDQMQYTGGYTKDHVGRPVAPVLGRDRF